MTEKKATIRDVAKACGYSVYTVSLVLNNKRGVAESTAEIVRQAIRDLDYNPLDNLPGTNRIRHKTLGIVVPSAFCEAHPFYQRAVAVVRILTSIRDYDCKLFTEEDVIRRLQNEEGGEPGFGTVGLIVFCPNQEWEKYVPKLLDKNLPVVLLRRSLPSQPGLLVIQDDDREGMMKAMAHLHQVHHHSCIGLCGFHISEPTTNPRYIACMDYMKEHGCRRESGLILESKQYLEMGEQGLVEWVRTCRKEWGMTAVICWSDQAAALLVKSLLKAGIRVPDDMAVMGVNNDPTSSIFHPGISTVLVPVEEMVTAACRYLLDYSVKTPPKVQTQFHQSLVIRDSCGKH